MAEGGGRRLRLTLDTARAAKLARVADRVHVSNGALASELLSSAIDRADLGARTILEVLEGIQDVDEGIREARDDYREGRFADLSDLQGKA